MQPCFQQSSDADVSNCVCNLERVYYGVAVTTYFVKYVNSTDVVKYVNSTYVVKYVNYKKIYKQANYHATGVWVFTVLPYCSCSILL